MAWHDNVRVDALWTINEHANAWAWIDGAWRKFDDAHEDSVTNMTILAAHEVGEPDHELADRGGPAEGDLRMVTPGPGSRPAELTQADVDDLARGNHDGASQLRRTASPQPSSAPREVDVAKGGARPVDLSPKDIDAIRRTGRPPAAAAKRLAAAERVEARGRAKAAKRTGSAPSVPPPGLT